MLLPRADDKYIISVQSQRFGHAMAHVERNGSEMLRRRRSCRNLPSREAMMQSAKEPTALRCAFEPVYNHDVDKDGWSPIDHHWNENHIATTVHPKCHDRHSNSCLWKCGSSQEQLDRLQWTRRGKLERGTGGDWKAASASIRANCPCIHKENYNALPDDN